ncbi:MAG TPA: hypothetical protein VKD67_08080 [Acidimicrobiales bacterium]|nr:hypothetical protein [Acidimicrobiales bacterium]
MVSGDAVVAVVPGEAGVAVVPGDPIVVVGPGGAGVAVLLGNAAVVDTLAGPLGVDDPPGDAVVDPGFAPPVEVGTTDPARDETVVVDDGHELAGPPEVLAGWTLGAGPSVVARRA